MYSTILQSIIITILIWFNIALTNVDARLKQRCINVVPKLSNVFFSRCFNARHWRCINVVQRWKSEVGCCSIFNVGSTLFLRWSTTLKQRWNAVWDKISVKSIENIYWCILYIFFLHFEAHNCLIYLLLRKIWVFLKQLNSLDFKKLKCLL